MRMSSKEKLYLRNLILANLEVMDRSRLCVVTGVSRYNLWRFLAMKRPTVDYSLIVMLEDMMPATYRSLLQRPIHSESVIDRFIRTGETNARREQVHHHRDAGRRS